MLLKNLTFGSDVSASGWKRSSGDTRKAYDFTYDGLHRLKDAVYKEVSLVNDHYTEKVTGYDRNGNITGLQRYGRTDASTWAMIDNLTLTRTGNLLTSVTDSGSAVYSGDFNAAAGTSTYNANGALTSDTGRKISSVTWNEIDPSSGKCVRSPAPRPPSTGAATSSSRRSAAAPVPPSACGSTADTWTLPAETRQDGISSGTTWVPSARS